MNDKIYEDSGKEISLIVTGDIPSEWYIQTAGEECKRVRLHKDDFGTLNNVTRIVFDMDDKLIEWFLNQYRALVDCICRNLLNFEVIKDNAESGSRYGYFCKDGILYYQDDQSEVLVKYPIGRQNDTVEVKISKHTHFSENEICIADGAFMGASYVKRVEISDHIRSIYSRTFKNCISLEEILSQPLKYIGENAFENCFSLKKLNIDPEYKVISVDPLKIGASSNKRRYELWDVDSNITFTFSASMRKMVETISEEPWRYDRLKLNGQWWHLSQIGNCGISIQCVRYSRSDGSDIVIIEGNDVINGDELDRIFRTNDDGSRYLFIGNEITGFEMNHNDNQFNFYKSHDMLDDWSIFNGDYRCVSIGNSVNYIDKYVFNPNSVIEDMRATDLVKFLWPQWFQKGKMVMGKYDGKPIRWHILEKQGDSLLLICEKQLDKKQYHEELANISWKNCSLRRWLNSEFLNIAFSAEELDRIQSSVVANDDEKEIRDKIYLLSLDEMDEYFPENNYGFRDFFISEELYDFPVWLRDNTDESAYAFVQKRGYFDDVEETDIDSENIWVRPVMRVSL